MTVVNVTVIFFAQARELSKLKSTTVQLPQSLFGHDLRSVLVNKFNLSSIGNIFILAVNEIYVSDNLQITLKENDIVAVIPPISGGSKLVLHSYLKTVFLETEMQYHRNVVI